MGEHFGRWRYGDVPNGGPSYAFVGWVGIAYGFGGMNTEGVAYGCNHSDTLNNPLAGAFLTDFFDAKLVSSGEPIGFLLRDILAKAHNADEAATMAYDTTPTFGWNFLFADKAGTLRSVEVRRDVGMGGVIAKPGEGRASWTPDPKDPAGLDSWGEPWASVKDDDIRAGAHFGPLANDFAMDLGVFNLRPQRDWSSYYFSSVRAMANLGEQIAAQYGKIDLTTMIAILRTPVLVDAHDSMTAIILEPGLGKLHAALGTVPATDSDFDTFDLTSAP